MDERDAVTMTIDGKDFSHWSDLEITLSIDSHATVGFSAPFEPERVEFRNTFRPFSFKPLTISIGGARLFTGTLIDVMPNLSPTQRLVSVSAYSMAAVLADCDMPAGSVPFEANGLSLRQIAERLAAPFGVSVVLATPDGTPFKRVNTKSKKVDGKADQDQKVQDFLAELARQRGLVISSTPDGACLLHSSVAAGNPVARFEEGVGGPMVSAVPTLNPTQFFSEITGFVSSRRGQVGSKYTQRLDRLAGGVLRSMSFRLDDVERADAPKAVAAKVGRMLAGAYSVVVNLDTLRDPRGNVWTPNTTVVVNSPSAMIYGDFEFLVRDVILRQSAGETTASLGLVMPGAFSSEIPDRMPWQEQ